MAKIVTIPRTVKTATQKVLPIAKGKSVFMAFFWKYTLNINALAHE